jgi:hypothetical protein
MRKAPFFAVAVVGLLTILEHTANSELLFDLLFPGLAVGLLMTGGHGGTMIEEAIAPSVSFAVNVAVYAVVFMGIVKIQRRLRR